MVSIEDLHKSFGDHQVLSGVSLEIRESETITIIGGSGCGKSVLLKHIVGLLKPERGRISVEGEDITKMDSKALADIQRQFGVLFQGSALFDSLSVFENVAFGLRHLKNLTEEEISKVVSEKLEAVGLVPGDVAALKPSELSGGMKKRVALARAIAMGPRYILYDEPTTGLDPIMADVINNLIRELQKKLSVTSVVVTHDMTSAYKISDRIAMLHEGKIVEVDEVSAIKNTKNPLVRQFVTGSSQGPIQMRLRERG